MCIFDTQNYDSCISYLGMSLSAEIPGCLTTVSSDKMFKVWDCRDDKPQCVLTRDVKMVSTLRRNYTYLSYTLRRK